VKIIGPSAAGLPPAVAPRHRSERMPAFLVSLAALCAAVILMLPMADVLLKGLPILSLEFLLENPGNSGRSGGIASILVSTALIVGISLAAALPLAFGTAILLSEYLPQQSIFASMVRGSLDILAGVPSIIFGLFGLAFFCRQLGLGYSILAGGLTLACMILPTLTRSICTAFDAIGNQYSISGAALGLSRVATLWHVTLPVALPGVTAGIVLGLTRALAETAVLLFTSGYADRMPESLHDSGRSVSVHIYELATNVPGGQSAAYGSALVLMALLGLLSIFIHAVSHRVQHSLVDTNSTSGR
jgi:phosphate transport system permease protein